VNDFHCFEGWSVLDFKWVGVEIEHNEKLVKPTIVTRAVPFVCSENYTT
jgi:DMSO/TMAO reductase YedYZ molybdopterin-dependent catalytic subunit